MSKAMFKPDAALDGQEFSAMTRILEALHERKEAGVDMDALDAATEAQTALEQNSFVGEEDLSKLVDAVKQYKKACEDDKLEAIPNVKGMELDRLIKKLEGMQSAQETIDENGKKVHPAAMPAGKEPEKKEPEVDAQNVRIVETPESKEKKEQEPVEAPAMKAKKK